MNGEHYTQPLSLRSLPGVDQVLKKKKQASKEGCKGHCRHREYCEQEQDMEDKMVCEK